MTAACHTVHSVVAMSDDRLLLTFDAGEQARST